MAEFSRALTVALLAAAAAYWFGRRAKIDDVRIQKVHDLAQRVSIAFQDVHGGVTNLRSFYKSNFELAPSVHDAMNTFRQNATGLYASGAAAVDKYSEDKRRLSELVKEARVYFPNSLCEVLDAYLQSCRFGWSNVWPLFDTFLEGMFESLLDEQAQTRRALLEPEIIQGLKKIVS